MSKKKEQKQEYKDVKDLIIDEAVKQFKEGRIKNSLDVTNFLDGLLQPLMQKLLDTELDNHLEYDKYEHSKEKKPKIPVTDIAKQRQYRQNMEILK